jgi:tRNA threonylcarbamoyladenosine biosynthesis protein TsaE
MAGSQAGHLGPLELRGEGETERLGACFADAGLARGVVWLEGDLGAGKTTWVRGFLRRLGARGPVRSPTFTLVETYALAGLEVCHFDLYRLAKPAELEDLGLRDYLDEGALVLFEWPERGAGVVPAADLRLVFRHLAGEEARVAEAESRGRAHEAIVRSAASLFAKHSNT